MKIDNYKEPEKILSYNEARIITKKEYAILKNIAKKEKQRIEQEICMGPANSTINQLIIENNINMKDYSELSTLKKEVMLANAILPDDTKVIDTLTENGFTLEHIKNIIKFRGILKNQVMYSITIDEELKDQIIIYKKVVTILINIFKDKFNVSNSTIILNRICELLVTSPELFETLAHPKRLKR